MTADTFDERHKFQKCGMVSFEWLEVGSTDHGSVDWAKVTVTTTNAAATANDGSVSGLTSKIFCTGIDIDEDFSSGTEITLGSPTTSGVDFKCNIICVDIGGSAPTIKVDLANGDGTTTMSHTFTITTQNANGAHSSQGPGTIATG